MALQLHAAKLTSLAAFDHPGTVPVGLETCHGVADVVRSRADARI